MTDTLIQRLRDYGCCNIRKDAAVSRAQPAAPAILMSAVFVKEGADDFAPQRLLPCGSAVYLAPPDAAPSVAPEPVALNSGVWTVARSALSSMAHMDHEALTSIQWPTMASPSKERLQFARRVEAAVRAALTVLIAQSLESNPPRAPLSDEQKRDLVKECDLDTKAPDSPAVAGLVERTVRPLLDRLRAGCTDWDGTEMVDETQPMDCLTVGDVRDAVTEIQRLRAELQHARDGLTKGRSRMREDLERHKPLVQAVEWVVEEGHMHVEDLARLRAALDGLRPNVGIEPRR